MIDEIRAIEADATGQIESASSLDEVRTLETDLLGKRSPLAGLKKRLGGLDADGRRAAGQAMNAAQAAIAAALAKRREGFEAEDRRRRLEQERLDLTEVRPQLHAGHVHLVTQTIERLEDVFVGLGFTVSEGPEADLPRVFERFFRSDEAQPSGIGLGLWICRGLVEAHGGELRVESKVGAGTTLSFTVPAATDG